MNTGTKEELAGRFARYPMLYMLVRTLLFGFWLRIVVCVLLLVPLAFVLLLPKIWRATPSHVKPKIKISGLDYFQARSLERAARQHFQNGDVQEALAAWQSALANNPGNVQSIRDFLSEGEKHLATFKHASAVLPQAVWLLRLTQTNLVDLEIAGRAFSRYNLNQYLLSLLTPRKDRLTPSLQKLYLIASFHEGRMEDFVALWQATQSQQKWLSDPELAIYWSAYEAGWTKGGEGASALSRLQALIEDQQWRVTASTLYLRVCERLGRVDEYLSTLDRLRAWQRDSVRDNVKGWMLLWTAGRQAEAIKQASDFPSRPMSALDTLMLVQAYYDLGLADTAMTTLDRFTLEYSFFDELWVTYGNLLVEAKQWDQLRQLAFKIRLNPEVDDRLAAFSHYLEGRAELGQDRKELANNAFARISNCRVQNLGLAFSLAKNLRRLGYPKIACDVLIPQRDAAEKAFEFWDLLARSAFEIKDGELLRNAVAKAFQLAPTNPEVMHNYAGALLVLREKPEEALKYTRELSQKFSTRTDVKLNYAMALIQNRQFAEAEKVLGGLSRWPLADSEKAAYNYARFELLVSLKRFDEAKVVRAKIRQEDFFPAEIKHLEQLKEQLGNS